MALWKSIADYCKRDSSAREKLADLYNRYNLPHKVRSTFANWIESTNWDIRENTKLKIGEQLFVNLMAEIDKAVELNSDLDVQLDLRKAQESLRPFLGVYDTFVDNMRLVLRGEHAILSQFTNQDESELKHKLRNKVPEYLNRNNDNKLIKLDDQLKEINGSIMKVCHEQYALLLEINEKEEKLNNIMRTNHADKEQTSKKLQEEKAKAINRTNMIRKELHDLIYKSTQELLEHVFEEVWKERNDWMVNMKREFAGLSSPEDNSIQMLDMKFTKASELLLGWITMLDLAINEIFLIQFPNQLPCKMCKNLKEFLSDFKSNILPRHLQHILVVEGQKRILKVNGKKSNSLHLDIRMLGGLSLRQKHMSPKVSIIFLPEHELCKINLSVQTSDPSITTSGVDSLTNSSGNMIPICDIENGHERCFQEDPGKSSFVVLFRSLQLKNINRLAKQKGNDEYVTDCKYGFLVQTTIKLLEQTYTLREVSLPIIITSQTSQEIMAKGTLIWHAAFPKEINCHSVSSRYSVREEVSWGEFAHVCSCLYLKHAERELSPDHLKYLATMLFRTRNSADFPNIQVSFSQIMKEKLPKKEFSLWKWLQACLNLVSTLVKKEWKDGYIYGFISKEDAKKMLEGKPCGTFLLRFSESHIDTSQKSDLCGYLTVAVQELDPDTGDLKLFHVRDYLSPKDIEERRLAPILGAMEVADYSNGKIKHKLLKFLWPHNKSFNEIFSCNLDKNKQHENNTGYSGGQFSIEIFLSERRQLIDNESDILSNPPSVNSSTFSNMDIFSPDLVDGFSPLYPYNSPKPTAKVYPAIHNQPDVNTNIGQQFLSQGIDDLISDFPIFETDEPISDFSNLETYLLEDMEDMEDLETQ